MREAFRACGWDAYSCDLLPADDDSPFHIQGDALDTIRRGGWDFIGSHPDCTFLSVSGIHWNNRGRGWERTSAALAFVAELVRLIEAADVAAYMENPLSILSTRYRKYDDRIQPHDFGEDASKTTCLWTWKLPRLKKGVRFPGRIVEWPPASGKFVERWGNQTDSGQNKLAPGPLRWKNRARSYPGVCAAMADQYTKFLAA